MSLDAVGIISKNIPESIKFYEILGISFKEVGGPDHFEGETPSGIRIMLDSIELMKKLNPEWIEPTGTGIVLCFKQVSAKVVNEIYNQVIKNNFKSVKEPWDAFWEQRYSSVQDPDGNQIDIFANI